MNKICTKCNLSKDEIEFRLRKDSRRDYSYLSSICKECEKNIQKDKYKNNPEFRERHKNQFNNFKSRNPDYFKNYEYQPTEEQIQKYSEKTKSQYIKNKVELLQKSKEWKMKHPRYYLQRKLKVFNMTIEDYDQLIIKQDNKCPICKNKFTEEFNRRPNIDHCHSSGKFRAILCHKCNTALGLFDDNMDSLQSAIEYLTQFRL